MFITSVWSSLINPENIIDITTFSIYLDFEQRFYQVSSLTLNENI